MVDHVSHQYRQVARNLGVTPEAVPAAVNKVFLPATKVATRSLLTADQDPVVLLQRCWLGQAAKGLNLPVSYRPAQEVKVLMVSVTEYLLGRYGDGLPRQIRNEVRTKLESSTEDTRRSGQIDPQQSVLSRREQAI